MDSDTVVSTAGNPAEDNDSKYDSFVFQEGHYHEDAHEPRTTKASKRYKQNIQFEPLRIEEEILLEDQEQVKDFPSGRKQLFFFLKLTSFWFANALLLACLVSIVWPSQIALLSSSQAIVGDERKEFYNGIIPMLGAVVSLIITPIAGIMSDYSNHRLGRRTVYIISGAAICVVFVVWAGSFGEGSNIWLLMICSAGIQFGANWAAGPYAGLMPDLVPRAKIGLASLMLAAGDLVGVLVAGAITSKKSYWPVYIFIAVTYSVFVLPTVIGIKERPKSRATEKLTVPIFFKSFYLNPKEYHDFYWVLLTRFLEQMGVYSILPFLQFFMQDVVKSDAPELWSSLMIALLVVVSIPSAIVAGKLSDKYGRKTMVYISSGLLASGMVALMLITLAPAVAPMMGVGVVMGLGYGAYQAVDWALALDVLPPGANIAKDMGIWHVAVVFPQVISPFLTGLVLNTLKRDSITTAYVVVCVLSAFWFILATIFVYPVRGARPPQTLTEDDL